MLGATGAFASLRPPAPQFVIPALRGAFDIAIWGIGHGTDIRASPASDGHVVASFTVPRAGRYTINIERQRGVDSGYWCFFRAELLWLQ
jgi:hypothetical protein